MAVNRFVLNGISYHGKGAIQEIPGIVSAKGFQKAFIVSDPGLVKFGITKKVTDLLDANGMAYEVYSDIKPNPTIENVKSGVEAYKKAIDAVRQLSVDVGIPTRLEGMKEEDLDFLAQSAAADACAPGNPKAASVEDFKELFRKVM